MTPLVWRRHPRPSHPASTFEKGPSYRAQDYRAQDALRGTPDLPVAASKLPAADWHDGQIASHGENAVKVKSSLDQQLRKAEFMAVGIGQVKIALAPFGIARLRRRPVPGGESPLIERIDIADIKNGAAPP